MDDIFLVQDEIARAVVRELQIKLGVVSAPSTDARRTDNLEAYTLYLKGRHHLYDQTMTALERSLACFSQAVDVEPDYARAHSGIALVHAVRAQLSFAPPHEAMPKAKTSALKALALDETVSEAHYAHAFVLHYYEWDWTGAEREYRRAQELNPGDAVSYMGYSELLAHLGRPDESVTQARHAVEHDPLSPLTRFALAYATMVAQRFNDAVAEARTAIELEPAFPLGYTVLSGALVALGRHEEAVEACRHAVTLAPSETYLQANLGWVLAQTGQRREARAILSDLEEHLERKYVSGTMIAGVHIALGNEDQAIACLRRAADERDPMLADLNTVFGFGRIRSDPRFQDLLRRMNFPTAE